MEANAFDILKKSESLAHAYLCYGDFKDCEDSFSSSLKESGIKLRSPGHYIFEADTFGVPEARDLVAWYYSGKTHNDDTRTVAVIAAKVIKKDAQQMLLKILEEARPPYSFFIFVSPGVEIIDTVLSRVQNIGRIKSTNQDIKGFIKLNTADRLKKVAGDIKGIESSELRAYTEELVRDLIFYFHKENSDESKEKLKTLLQVQNSLIDSHIAPKFILDYVITIL